MLNSCIGCVGTNFKILIEKLKYDTSRSCETGTKHNKTNKKILTTY